MKRKHSKETIEKIRLSNMKDRIEITCLYCNKISKHPKCFKDKKFCNMKCYYSYIRKNPGYRPVWNKLNRNYEKCEICGKTLCGYNSKTKRCQRHAYIGKLNPCWSGGRNRTHQDIRSLDRYTEFRKRVLIRDNYTCQICGVYKYKLEVHHEPSFIQLLSRNKINTVEDAVMCDDLFDINHGSVLCYDCHKTISKRSYKYELREFRKNCKGLLKERK